jgi:putative membrane protein insertion efficiency factor
LQKIILKTRIKYFNVLLKGLKYIKNTIILPRIIAIFLIIIYQKTISPDHGIFKNWVKAKYPAGYCRFFPTCSDYSIGVIKKYGLVLGAIKTVWRILRCNPWGKGGVENP